MERAFGWAIVQVASLKMLYGRELENTLLTLCTSLSSHCSGFGGAEIALSFLRSACQANGIHFQLQSTMSCAVALLLKHFCTLWETEWGHWILPFHTNKTVQNIIQFQLHALCCQYRAQIKLRKYNLTASMRCVDKLLQTSMFSLTCFTDWLTCKGSSNHIPCSWECQIQLLPCWSLEALLQSDKLAQCIIVSVKFPVVKLTSQACQCNLKQTYTKP